jgi:formiminotetrahydrofolate cyclodeaminase
MADSAATQYQLMELPARKLLDKFGAGSHKPGSGSAAALMGILSGRLTATVCKLSLEKPKYKNQHKELKFLIETIEGDIEPSHYKYFQRDAEIFDAVIEARRSRNAANSDERRRAYRRDELQHLREATDIPLKIGSLCLALIDHAVFTFDFGFQSARGDSGAAVSAAIAGVTAAAFVIHLNLKSFGRSQWQEQTFEGCQQMLAKLNEKQANAFTRLTRLSEEEIKNMDLDLGEVRPVV